MGVGRVHLIDGRVEHVVVLELFTPEGVGTMITPDVDRAVATDRLGADAP
jgi:acetylglutamate kinase